MTTETETKFEMKCESTSGAPTLTFVFTGDVFRCDLDGARLYGEADRDGASRIKLTSASGEVLADVTAHARGHRDATENATDIASALMWSHWRWTQSKDRAP